MAGNKYRRKAFNFILRPSYVKQLNCTPYADKARKISNIFLYDLREDNPEAEHILVDVRREIQKRTHEPLHRLYVEFTVPKNYRGGFNTSVLRPVTR